ncbi:MAG: cation:proton antiporter, partial [Nitrospinae bacterium]|nr:cation:proton antiporter [Nitrospinota bacterium]
MTHDFTIIQDAVVIFGLSIGVILLCLKVNAPAVVGFLLTGVLAGPHGLGLVKAVEEVETLAEIGVVLLLFVIGMEISFDQLSRLKKALLVGGGGQVGMTIAATYAACVLAGLPHAQSLFIGFLVALSSTAIVLTLLQQRAEVDTPYGRISLSILIFQDLVIVPMMLLVPALAGEGNDGTETMPVMLGKMVAVFAAVAFLGKIGAPFLLKQVVRTRSRELFLLTILTLCFAVGWLTNAAGLSLALGAFMAGMIVAESDYSHHALEGILPFRDVFTNLFFVSVGMLLDVGYFVANLPLVLAITLAIFVLKGLTSGGAALLLGYPVGAALLTGLALAQVGEFSFVLAGVGRGHGLLTDDEYQLFLAASVATMAATPFVIQRGRTLAALIIGWRPLSPLIRRLRHRKKATGGGKVASLSDHLIIIGFGVVGRHLGRAATVIGIPYTVIEMNPDTVRDYAARGESIAYGDATREATLAHAGIRQARALVVTIADPAAARRITQVARAMNPALYIATRTRFMSEIEPLRALGADDVASEGFITWV